MIHKESLCIMCGCCVSECNSMESDPEFLGPAALAKGMRFVGDPRDQAKIERLERLQRRARDLGLHALLLLQRALPEGRRPARRDREARRRGDEARASTTTWARSTRSGSSPRRRRPAGCARPSSCRRRRASSQSIKEMKFAMGLAQARQGAAARSRRTSPKDVDESRALYDLVKRAGPRRRARHRPGRARARPDRVHPGGRRGRGPDGPTRPEPSRQRKESDVRTVAYYKGCLASLSAKELDISTQALAPKVGLELDRARGGHLLRRRRHPRGRARLLPPPERAHPRLRGGDGLRHADDDLQRLHAQPAAGELRSCRATPTLLDTREREPREGRRAGVLGRGRRPALPLAHLGRARATSCSRRRRTRA